MDECAASFTWLGMTVETLTDPTPRVTEWGFGRGWVIGTFLVFGMLGAALRLVLGATGGLLVALLTRSGSAEFRNAPSYPRVAGGTCAGWAVLALLADWLVHDFPNANGSVLVRGFGGGALGEDTSVVGIVVLALVPIMLLVAGMWWAGRKTASRYARSNRRATQ